MSTQYTGKQSLLNAALGPYHAHGFRIVPKGEQVILFYRDERADTLDFETATISSLQRACADYLRKVGVN